MKPMRTSIPSPRSASDTGGGRPIVSPRVFTAFTAVCILLQGLLAAGHPVVAAPTNAAPVDGAAGARQVADVVDLRVALAAEPLVRGESVLGAVELSISEGFHVNATPPTYEYLIPTGVSVVGAEGVEVSEEFHPEPLHRSFPYTQEPLAVYEGSTVIGFRLDVSDSARSAEGPLRLRVRYQACNDTACLAPTDAEVEIPVSLADAGTATSSTDSELLRRAPLPAEQDDPS